MLGTLSFSLTHSDTVIKIGSNVTLPDIGSGEDATDENPCVQVIVAFGG